MPETVVEVALIEAPLNEQPLSNTFLNPVMYLDERELSKKSIPYRTLSISAVSPVLPTLTAGTYLLFV
jgi:hypothetical protein